MRQNSNQTMSKIESALGATYRKSAAPARLYEKLASGAFAAAILRDLRSADSRESEIELPRTESAVWRFAALTSAVAVCCLWSGFNPGGVLDDLVGSSISAETASAVLIGGDSPDDGLLGSGALSEEYSEPYDDAPTDDESDARDWRVFGDV